MGYTSDSDAARVAWVTGASRGIGRGVARALGQAGWIVYLTARSSAAGRTGELPGTVEETAGLVTSGGGRGVPVPCDHRDDAAVAAALPELDGIRLTLLSLLNTDGGSWLQVLARGLELETPTGPFGIDSYFPVSVWIRDSGGRWHACRPAGGHSHNGEYVGKLQLVPPLTRSAEWIEVLAAGPSAQVRVQLPLRWRYL